MRKERWELWLENPKLADTDFKRYLKRNVIRESATALEKEGHLSKAKRNLHFARRIIDDFNDFYEWALVVYYYALYQAALALCASKGFKTKSHAATICILIKFFYPKHINKDDLKVVASMMAEEDIREFVELKNYREDATYSISFDYERSLAEELGEKAIAFVNKAEMIIAAI